MSDGLEHRHVFLVNENLSFIGPFGSDEHPQQRRFARSTGPHEKDKFSLTDLKVTSESAGFRSYCFETWIN